jgi:hypothetical protein
MRMSSSGGRRVLGAERAQLKAEGEVDAWMVLLHGWLPIRPNDIGLFIDVK